VPSIFADLPDAPQDAHFEAGPEDRRFDARPDPAENVQADIHDLPLPPNVTLTRSRTRRGAEL
jgi:hypothetical protein